MYFPLSIKTWWGYWIFIIAAYSQMSSPKASVQPHWRVSHRVLPWIFGKKLWNLQVGWLVGEVKLCKSQCSWCNNMKWTIKLIEMWRQILLFSSASSISHHTSHKDSSSFTIDLSEIHSGASLLVTTSALGAFGPWPYGLQLLYRGPPADAQALCAALKVCQEQRWSQGAASHWVSVRISRYFMGKINKLVNG